jgi:glycosyltransferase involved in cell wall biosynthesis
MTPLVSIIIPAYNAAQWLRESVGSALVQTWPSKEILVIDDGSTDGTIELARDLEKSGVQVIAQTNGGASRARNAGLRAARGDYIQFLDADDLLAADKIEQQMAVLQSRGPRVLSSSAWARFRDDPREASFAPEANWRDLTGVEFLQLHYEQHCMMQPAAWLASRELLEAAGPWNEALTLNDDGEYFARVMLQAEGIVFVEKARSFYRSGRAGSLSGRKDQKALTSLFESVRLTLSCLETADQSPRTSEAIAYAWKWTSFELYPGAPELARRAEENCARYGGSRRPLPASGRFKLLAPLLGWRLAKRLTQ